MGEGWMQLALVHDLVLLFIREGVCWGSQEETFSWCVSALIMNTGLAISFKVPALIRSTSS